MLYATREEAAEILDWAKGRGLTGNNYVWIVTQSVIGESRNGQAPSKPTFPIGMLGNDINNINNKVMYRDTL